MNNKALLSLLIIQILRISNYDLRTSLFLCYQLKKKASQVLQMLLEVYGGACFRKSIALHVLRNASIEMMAEQLGVTQNSIYKRLKDIGMISKDQSWSWKEAKEPKTTYEMLLYWFKRESYFGRIVTSDENW